MNHDEKIQTIKNHLLASRQKLKQALAGVQGEDWNIPVQEDGDRWTILQMVRHLQDAQKGLTGQAQRLSQGQVTVPTDFDVNRWNTRIQNKTAEANMSAEEALTALDQGLTDLLTFIDTIHPDAWEKIGWQPFLQKELPLYDFLNVIVVHENDHAEEIARAVANAKS